MRSSSRSAGGRAIVTTAAPHSSPSRTRRPDDFAEGDLAPEAAHWDSELGEFVLDWEDIRSHADPHALAPEFARSAFGHASAVCEWDPALAASAEGNPPPIS
jgi:hypothetical protein